MTSLTCRERCDRWNLVGPGLPSIPRSRRCVASSTPARHTVWPRSLSPSIRSRCRGRRPSPATRPNRHSCRDTQRQRGVSHDSGRRRKGIECVPISGACGAPTASASEGQPAPTSRTPCHSPSIPARSRPPLLQHHGGWRRPPYPPPSCRRTAAGPWFAAPNRPTCPARHSHLPAAAAVPGGRR